MTPLERLHDAMLDDSLDAGQLAELRTLLADPGQGRAWWRLTTLAGRLHEELGAVAPAARTRRKARPAHRWWSWSGLAAAAGLALLLAGWLVLRAPPPARLEGGGLSVAGIALRPGDAIPAGSPAAATGDGALVLADGSRCAWTGAARFAVSSGGALLRLDSGDLRVQAATQPAGRSLAIVTADCEARVVGTRFRVITLPDRTCVGVEEGTVAVQTSAGLTAIAAGQATTAVAGKLPLAHPLASPATWARALDGPLLPGWLGRPVAGGLAAAADPDEPATDLRRLVRTPRTAPPGLAGLRPGLICSARISAARPGQVEVFLVCSDQLTGDFRGLLHTKAPLAGDGTLETVRLGLDRFVTAQAVGPLDGSASVSCVILQWWKDDLASVVSAIALEP